VLASAVFMVFVGAIGFFVVLRVFLVFVREMCQMLVRFFCVVARSLKGGPPLPLKPLKYSFH
jgi:hypothetical protein